MLEHICNVIVDGGTSRDGRGNVVPGLTTYSGVKCRLRVGVGKEQVEPGQAMVVSHTIYFESRLVDGAGTSFSINKKSRITNVADMHGVVLLSAGEVVSVGNNGRFLKVELKQVD